MNKLIVGSLVFMVAEFILLVQGWGTGPNPLLFVSIATGIIAGTLLVLGFLQDRKRQGTAPAAPGKTAPVNKEAAIQSPSPVAAAAQAQPQPSGWAEVEADLKALEQGEDEEEVQALEPAAMEPIVAGAGTKAGASRGTSRKAAAATAVLEPAMSAGGSGGQGGPGVLRGQPDRGELTGMTGQKQGDQGGQPGGSPNVEWTGLISPIDQEKFDPPVPEPKRPKAKTNAPQGSQSREEPTKEAHTVQEQMSTSKEQTDQGDEKDKARRGIFGMFRGKSAKQEPAAAMQTAGPADTLQEPAVPLAAPSGAGDAMEDSAPDTSADAELTAAQQEAAQEMGKPSRPEDASRTMAKSRPAGRSARSKPKTKTAAKPKTGAKSKTAAKPKPAAKPKTGAKPKAPAKPKTGGVSQRAAKPKTGVKSKSPAKPATAKRKTASKPKTAAKPKS